MHKISLLGISVLLFSQLAWSQQSDSFDDFDKMLDQRFEDVDSVINARYEAVELAVDRAFQGLTKKIEVHWGEDTRLPSKTEWVTYSRDMGSRVALDFSKSEMVIETVLGPATDMKKEFAKIEEFAKKLMSASPQQLNEEDSLAKEIKLELQESNVEIDVETVPVVSKTVPTVSETVDEVETVLAVVLPVAAIEESLQELVEQSEVILEQPLDTVTSIGGKAGEPTGSVKVLEENGIKKLQISFPFVSNAQKKIMEKHMDVIRKYASEYDIPVSVVLAIIETESSFNPRAVSPVPAFGLMQLVPRTAGIDAYNKVYGEKKVVAPEYLFNEAQNIELGAAYLNVVRDSYFRRVKNPYSRFYCTVAAYNTGIGNVAKTFTGGTSLTAAARKINTMNEQEVYDHLLENLPAEETRNYLRKIVKRVENYKHLDMG
jgi:membrane-bound lytic murein transglycosylase C